MSRPDTAIADQAPTVNLASRRSPRIWLLPALVLIIPIAAIELWAQGWIPHMMGLQRQETSMPSEPVLIELPEMVTNLHNDPQRPQYIKLRAQLQTLPVYAGQVKLAMPRLIDVFQSYLREIRPAELQGALGTYRLREELIARATIAVLPAKINDVLFEEILVQ